MIYIGMPQLYEFDTVEDNLELAKELGLDFIELNLNFGYCRKEMEEGNLASLLSRYGIRATLHFYDEADLGSYPEIVDGYLTLLKRYALLGKGYIEQVNIHLIPGPVVTIAGVKHYIYEKEFDEYIERLVVNLKSAESICNANGMELVIENTDCMPAYTEKTYERLIQEGFRFCFDIGHDHLSGDLLWNLQNKYKMHFGEFHIHDALNRKKCHLALGQGELIIAPFKRLAEANDAFVVLEVKQKSDLEISVPLFKKM